MEIDAMRSKELGIAVAKEVMGWTEYGVGNEYPLFDAMRQKGAIFVLESPDKRWRQWSGWRSMDDAWEVVDKLLEYAYPFDLRWRGPKGDDSWVACFGFLVYARVPCEVILRAALKTVRGER